MFTWDFCKAYFGRIFSNSKGSVDAIDSVEKRCELLAEEGMTRDLYELIWQQENKISYLNKYGFLLADDYSEQILQAYRDVVTETAEYARNRAQYRLLTGYLQRMQKYEGGMQLVRNLCMQWIEKYSTRKVMVQELNELLHRDKMSVY